MSYVRPSNLLFVLCVLSLLVPGVAVAAMDHVPGQVLAFLAEDVTLTDLTNAKTDADLTATLADLGLGDIAYIANPLHKSTGTASRFVLLHSDRDDFDPVTAARRLMTSPLIVAASPNYIRPLLYTPNDPDLPSQWHVLSDAAGANLTDAWDLEVGCAAAVIAIMDTGIDTGHPDLAAAMWTNPGEVAGNGIDDDGNGYIDDVYGWDFGQDDNDPRPHNTPDATGIDVGFHGTHCAGIASAVTDNGVGVAGAGFGCSLMALKLPDTAGAFTDVAITGAFLYAIDNGADVLSMSFGGPDEDGMAAFMQNLVDQAVTAGVICVAAAGNDNTSEMFYPAACSGVISVGATDESNQRASFSSYGTWVDIAAPGNRIWSTICDNYAFGWLDQFLYMLSFEWDGTNPYMYSDGTSMAAPLVAGVCGLMRCVRPGMTPDQACQRLIDTGDVVAFDQPIGVKLNAYGALHDLGLTPTPEITAAHLAVHAFPNPFNPSLTVAYTVPQSGPVQVRVYDGAGRLVRTLVDEVQGAGPQTTLWNGRTDSGARAASGAYLVQVGTPVGSARQKIMMLK